MATSFAPVSISGASHLKASELGSRKVDAFRTSSKLILQKKFNKVQANNKLSVRAEYSGNRNGGGDFAAGFIIGGALFGSLAYVFAPQIRRAILNEDEHGFRKPRKLYYEDEGVFEGGLEKTRETLNAKIGQLNSAIDKVASRLRGGSGKNNATPPYDTAPEIEFTV